MIDLSVAKALQRLFTLTLHPPDELRTTALASKFNVDLVAFLQIVSTHESVDSVRTHGEFVSHLRHLHRITPTLLSKYI